MLGWGVFAGLVLLASLAAYHEMSSRYWVKVDVTTQEGKQLRHMLYVRALDYHQAKRRGVARASRRFLGCGVELVACERQ